MSSPYLFREPLFPVRLNSWCADLSSKRVDEKYPWSLGSNGAPRLTWALSKARKRGLRPWSRTSYGLGRFFPAFHLALSILIGSTLILWCCNSSLSVRGYCLQTLPAKLLSPVRWKLLRAGQETWLQVAGSGDLDLVINGHLIVAAGEYTFGNVILPQLNQPTPTPAPGEMRGRIQRRPPEVQPKSVEASQKEILTAYDVSYWIKKGENTITATVRADHRPASLFLTGFFAEKDGTTRQFESNSDWQAFGRPGQSSAGSQRAVQFGQFGVAPWGYIPQEPGRQLDRADFATLGKSCVVIALTAAIIGGLWLLVSGLVAQGRNELLRRALLRDALFHAPILIALVFLLLPNYDPRFPTSWSFTPAAIFGVIAALLGIRLFHLFPLDRVIDQAAVTTKRVRALPFREVFPYLLVILIMALGFALRFHNIAYMSFDHDEMGVVSKSKGIYHLGFPYATYAGEVRWITTYELIPYPLALAGLFGYSELTMRMPACIMGTLAIGLIALLGRRLFNWRIGVLAALVYACMPLNIRWAQNAFYLQQCQFFTLLTILLFYEAFRFRPLHRGLLHGRGGIFLCDLPFLGRQRLSLALPCHRFNCYALGRMVVASGLTSLPLSFPHWSNSCRAISARVRLPVLPICRSALVCRI